MDKIHLLIAGEDSSSTRGLKAIFALESTFNVLGSFSLNEAAEKAVALQPDVVLVDFYGGFAGYEQLLKKVIEECPCSIVLGIAHEPSEEFISNLIVHGIDGCIPKGITRGCLVKAVELACKAGLFCFPQTFKRVVSVCRAKQGERTVNNIIDLKKRISNKEVDYEELTKREMEILQLMSKSCSNREIGQQLFISEPTVKTHVSSILRKLGQSNRGQAILYAYKAGLVKDNFVKQN